MVEGHCLAMKIVHCYTNGGFHWLISKQQSDNPLREAILYCLGNTKDLRLSILVPLHSKPQLLDLYQKHSFILKEVCLVFVAWGGGGGGK